jgi:ureidoacrylate peracid hydrolase
MELLETLEQQVAPHHTAVLVIDMQRDFCASDGYLATARGYNIAYADAVANAISRLVDGARQAGACVVWIRSHYDFHYLAAPHKVKRVEEGCCLENSQGAEFYRLTPRPGEPVVDKHTFSGFFQTNLDSVLQGKGIKSLIVTGVATNVCVDSTLRDGFFRGYYIVVPQDCVGSSSKSGHEGTLATVQKNIGLLSDSAELIGIFSEAGG